MRGCDIQGVARGYCARRGCDVQGFAGSTALGEGAMCRVLQGLRR